MSALASDFKFAIRTLRRRSGLLCVVVLTLAIGIGATTSVFTIVNAVLFKPLPFRGPHRLVHIWEGGREQRYRPREDANFIFVRPGTFYDWQRQSSSFESISAYIWRKMILTRQEGAEVLWAHDVRAHFFETLGANAQLGRTFEESDYRPNAPRAGCRKGERAGSHLGETLGALGSAAAYVCGSLAAAQFYQVSGNDPETLVLTSFSLVAIALAASCVPARRALRVDPMVVLQ
jgi:ABC-type antimicrobial peptide transport system permease subunit